VHHHGTCLGKLADPADPTEGVFSNTNLRAIFPQRLHVSISHPLFPTLYRLISLRGCLTIRALVEYDPTDLQPISTLVTQALPQCTPDLPLLEGTFISDQTWYIC
jgi:hypothetical protein